VFSALIIAAIEAFVHPQEDQHIIIILFLILWINIGLYAFLFVPKWLQIFRGSQSSAHHAAGEVEQMRQHSSLTTTTSSHGFSFLPIESMKVETLKAYMKSLFQHLDKARKRLTALGGPYSDAALLAGSTLETFQDKENERTAATTTATTATTATAATAAAIYLASSPSTVPYGGAPVDSHLSQRSRRTLSGVAMSPITHAMSNVSASSSAGLDQQRMSKVRYRVRNGGRSSASEALVLTLPDKELTAHNPAIARISSPSYKYVTNSQPADATAAPAATAVTAAAAAAPSTPAQTAISFPSTGSPLPGTLNHDEEPLACSRSDSPTPPVV
jgi:hypothetical protein